MAGYPAPTALRIRPGPPPGVRPGAVLASGSMSLRVPALICACLLAALVAACSGPVGATPRPTAADFPGLTQAWAHAGITATDIRSGDPGCDDATLVGPAISFSARGLDQAEPTRIHLFIFRNRDAYDRRRADVDRCAAQFATDPATFEAVDAPPFVAVGAGPWGPQFRDALRRVMAEGAGAAGASATPGPS